MMNGVEEHKLPTGFPSQDGPADAFVQAARAAYALAEAMLAIGLQMHLAIGLRPRAKPGPKPKIKPVTGIDNAVAEDLLTLSEAAKIARCSPTTITSHVKRGEIPFVRIGKRKILIPRTAFLKQLSRPENGA